MTPFEKRQAQTTERIIQNWPQGAPEELKYLTRAEAREAFQISLDMEPMPDAELTPEMVAQRKLFREATRKSYRDFLKLGKMLLAAKATKQTEAEFWRFMEVYCPTVQKDLALLAMEAAQNEP